MSRPRKPFGANHPGRLPATMMKVLAAEMSDPSRLRRGKQYAKDGSILDIIIEPGVVTCEVQGSRSDPYIASVSVTSGDGMPMRRDITTTCTCPDDDNWDGYACKHVVATMFALGDEFLVEPELLDVWRDRSAVTSHERSGRNDDGDHDDDDGDDGTAFEFGDGDEVRFGRRDGRSDRSHRHLRLVGSGERVSEPDVPHVDPLAAFLAAPDGTVLPEIPEFDRIDPVLPRSRELAAIVRDALANLRIDWD